MNQDQAHRWAEEVLELADDYAEARHTKGDRSYNAETAAKREAIAAALVKLTQGREFIYVDAGHLREVLNGNEMLIHASPDTDGRMAMLFTGSAPSQQEDRKPQIVPMEHSHIIK